MSKSILINFLLFQLGWFAIVLGAAYNQIIVGSLIAVAVISYHVYRANNFFRELRLLIIALIIGILFESLITAVGLAQYSSGQIYDAIAPLWIILMWPLFATTLNLSMSWLKQLGLIPISLAGALFAPLAYFAGNNLGAVVYHDLALSLGTMAIAWSILLPLLVTFSLKFNGYEASTINTNNTGAINHV